MWGQRGACPPLTEWAGQGLEGEERPSLCIGTGGPEAAGRPGICSTAVAQSADCAGFEVRLQKGGCHVPALERGLDL